MDKKKLIFKALQLVNRTTNPNVMARLLEKTSDVQQLSEETLFQVCGGAIGQIDPYIVYCIQPD